ncbi:PilW family protein [Colwellia sp. 12G3]|uniref:PilW family protein n=1 Tax=Colwellia sp. 12G3 TaxID=2058299 RepID=UPI000C331496|nr:PilW family protein [Colwellia sp. 12G3]PKI14286.1 prepilin-type cleavage/methylation domain-containing protein [Colwellia sp. 12G3]
MNNSNQIYKPISKRTKASKSLKGFTLVELMISLAIGLILFSGVMSIFVGMRTTTAETSSYGELQENGRFAISVLTDDLLNQNLWGDYPGTFGIANLTKIPAAPGNDCVGGGVNNATFPLAVGHFRTLWGQTLTAAQPNPLGCFPTRSKISVGSDVIQIKRVIANPLTVLSAGNYYLTTNTVTGGIFPFGGATPVLDNARTWKYQHHVYYVRDETVGNNVVPVLMQGRLANFRMGFAPVVDGIEVIRFMYGIGPESTGVVSRFVSASTMDEVLWDNAVGTRILAVKIYVLARSIFPDNKYQNTNTYQLGNLALPVNDNFRRLLFSSTVTLYNASVDSW